MAELRKALVTPGAADEPTVTLSILAFEFERACAELHAGAVSANRTTRA